MSSHTFIKNTMYLVTLLLGITMTFLGLSIQNDMAGSNVECPSSVRRANTGVIVLGVTLLTATIVILWSNHSYRKCAAAQGKMGNEHVMGYYIFTVCISIILTTLGAIMRNNVDKATNPACQKIKQKANFLMYLGIIGILITLGPIVVVKGGKAAHSTYTQYQQGSKSRRHTRSQDSEHGIQMQQLHHSPVYSSAMCGSKRSEM